MRLLLSLVLVTSAAAQALPIPPQSLWALSHASDAIVFASVESVRRDSGQELATLQVEKVLKGNPGVRVEVESDVTLICPAPVRFLVGESGLYFLGKERGWRVVAETEGVRRVAQDQRPQVEQAVALALSVSGSSERARVAWALWARRQPQLRAEGEIELESWQLFALANRSAASRGDFTRQIESRWLEQPSYSADAARFMEMLARNKNSEITRVLAEVIQTSFAVDGFDNSDWLHELIDSLERRLGSEPAREGCADCQPWKALRLRWERVKAQHDLRPEVRSDAPVPEVVFPGLARANPGSR